MSADAQGSGTEDVHKYVPLYMAHNAKTMQFARAGLAAISGSAAGILGLKNLYGFAFYAVNWVLISFLLLAIKTQFKPQLFFKGGAKDIFTDGFIGGLLSYILFHTFLYGLVHLYQ
ncbi:hypothetical protein INT44_006930 [Umbelopsis vinacea]|uniref:ER membrane protein complex subunit 6 n=1 Tax=Umbelopsis vinacea TaxID=44442 RepID=A0A8H7U7R5_9FUNG|nr:hypothetical protein INT44_006930 [Umbelopsis vinacea]KAI9289997.1 hypothetical protein BC943DRAFT_313064 [Umbelopsis sp. AD052]